MPETCARKAGRTLAAFPFLERVGGVWCCYRAHLLYSFCAHSVWCFYRAHLLQHPVVILVGAKIYYTLPTKDPKLPLPLPPAQPGQAQPGPAWPGPAWPGQVQARTGHALASVDPPSPTQRLDTEIDYKLCMYVCMKILLLEPYTEEEGWKS